eukprot:CAMPEP_0170503790 /NCGR_PEP_ID=MMETSP0208-20121228/45918_1 /TAXON_ID=197538 /ORGANISM="Strombidium inclinatum, Strain S3" /LENGTH=35 /DNA_ID= /DNA_START= /DNA_END= /DNA_ORIENTATION=
MATSVGLNMKFKQPHQATSQSLMGEQISFLDSRQE